MRINHNLINNLRIIFLISLGMLILGSVGYYIIKPHKTLIYFNAETDIPKNELYITPNQDAAQTNFTGAPINQIDRGKTYNIYFSIASLEKKKMNYTYRIDSDILSDQNSVMLRSDEVKKVHIILAPREEDKWSPPIYTEETFENIIDLTANSWLAEKRDFQVLVENGALPTLTQEDYHLPISNEVSGFGKIYHINLSLSELRAYPFYKEYNTLDISDFSKVNLTDSIKLYIKDNELHLESIRKTIKYISKPKSFIISLFEEKDIKDTKVDFESGIEEVKRLSFWYQIK